jgi:hypothetical protein
MGRLYYTQEDGKLVSKDFKTSFIDFEVILDAEGKKTYDRLNLLLKTMTSADWST